MKPLNEKFMSDEETDVEDSNSFVKRSLKNRSPKLNKLMRKLDQRYMDSREKKKKSKPLKIRKIGPPSTRLLPACSPDWVIAVDSSTSSSLDDSSDNPGASDDINSTASSATVSPSTVNPSTLSPQVTPQRSVPKTVRRNVVPGISCSPSSTSSSSSFPVINNETSTASELSDEETTSDIEWIRQAAGVPTN